jgi:hypothetical protein
LECYLFLHGLWLLSGSCLMLVLHSDPYLRCMPPRKYVCVLASCFLQIAVFVVHLQSLPETMGQLL